MAKQFPGQFKDEDVLFVFKRHPIVMRKGLLIILITILIGALAGTYMSRSAVTAGEFFSQFFTPVGIGFLVGFVALFYHWIGWYYSVCIVTSERFLQLTQVGIFRKRSSNDINLNRIISVNYEIHGMLETVLGFGTIIIQTMVGDFIITKVPKPAQTQANIVSAIKESGVELSEEIQEDI